jgi:hypothetical protein
MTIEKTQVQEEWERVKDKPSLLKHYGDKTMYRRWRYQFVKYNLIQPTSRTKELSPKKSRKDYMRTYARKWRRTNPDLARKIVERYWIRKLCLAEDHDRLIAQTQPPVQ